jgi:hypothetical protein
MKTARSDSDGALFGLLIPFVVADGGDVACFSVPVFGMLPSFLLHAANINELTIIVTISGNNPFGPFDAIPSPYRKIGGFNSGLVQLHAPKDKAANPIDEEIVHFD